MLKGHYSHLGGKSVNSEFRIHGILSIYLSLLFAVGAIFNLFSH